jgi:hypothetical protein
LAIDPNQEIFRLPARHFLGEEFLNSQALVDFQVIGKTIKLSTNLAIRTRLQNRT